MKRLHIVLPLLPILLPLAAAGSENITATPGRHISAYEAVYPQGHLPKRIKDLFKKESDSLPKAESIDGSLYLCKADSSRICIAKGDESIRYGQSVSRHEFGIEDGIFFSPDSSALAFYRKDESLVDYYTFHDITSGETIMTRYPMNSSPSERVSVGVYDITAGSTTYLDTAPLTGPDGYIACISYHPDGSRIFVHILDRAQQNLSVVGFDAATGKSTGILLTEHSDTWVEPKDPLRWIDANRCIYTTDNRDGVQNLYLVDLRTAKAERLASHDHYMEYVGNDGRSVYFQGPDDKAVNNYLWKVTLKGSRKAVNLTPEEGWHSIEMAPDCKSFLDVFENLNSLPESTLRSAKDGKITKVLQSAEDPASDIEMPQIEMGTIPAADGSDTNYYRLVKPTGFDPSKKYPLILYVYGGPHSQMVRNSYMGGYRQWELYAAQKGFAVLVMDGRGTLRHGSAYEHAIFGRCGVCEAQDQMEAVKMLRTLPWVDQNRIGVDGWSYGGFMALTLATLHPETFKVCVAGGPVIDWRWYEVMYGERYMGRVSENPERFDAVSLLGKAKNLKDVKTLIIQGALDDTVLPHNASSFLQKCIDEGVQVDYFEYPKAKHNMKGSDRVHLMDKITDYFIENL